jgi:hypothetical protein
MRRPCHHAMVLMQEQRVGTSKLVHAPIVWTEREGEKRGGKEPAAAEDTADSEREDISDAAMLARHERVLRAMRDKWALIQRLKLDVQRRDAPAAAAASHAGQQKRSQLIDPHSSCTGTTASSSSSSSLRHYRTYGTPLSLDTCSDSDSAGKSTAAAAAAALIAMTAVPTVAAVAAVPSLLALLPPPLPLDAADREARPEAVSVSTDTPADAVKADAGSAIQQGKARSPPLSFYSDGSCVLVVDSARSVQHSQRGVAKKRGRPPKLPHGQYCP